MLWLMAASLLVATAGEVSAQSTLTEALGEVEWGTTIDDVLAQQQERILEVYRTEIAGVHDPLEIDRLRRIADENYAEIANSREALDGARTGYEVSVIQDEVDAGVGQALFVVREEWNLKYFVFESEEFTKLIVTYDQASLNFLGFEGFVERLESVFGDPTATDWRVDDIGVRHMTRATWEDETTRVRAEDKSRMFASYILVYTSVADTSDAPSAANSGSGGAERPGDSRNLGALIRQIDDTGGSGRDNSAVVDEILGSPTEVNLQLMPVDEASDMPEIAGQGASALDDDEELEDAERLERRSRRSQEEEEEEEEEEEGGELIY